MRKLLLTIGVIFLITSISFSQTNAKETVKSDKEISKVVPDSSIPKSENNLGNTQKSKSAKDSEVRLINLSNTAEDQARNKAAWEEWVKKNPEEYKRRLNKRKKSN